MLEMSTILCCKAKCSSLCDYIGVEQGREQGGEGAGGQGQQKAQCRHQVTRDLLRGSELQVIMLLN